jgi:hypothetical protein
MTRVEDMKRKLAIAHGIESSNVIILEIRPESTTHAYVLNVNLPTFAVIEDQYK